MSDDDFRGLGCFEDEDMIVEHLNGQKRRNEEMGKYKKMCTGTDVSPEELYTYYHVAMRAGKYKRLTERSLYMRIKDKCRENDIPTELDIHIVSALMDIFRADSVRPILLIGGPGCGKTYLARIIAEVAGLGFYKISAPGASVGRGLTGDAKSYRSAKYGEIVASMVKTDSKNPVVLVDEVDKCSMKRDVDHNISDELLSALDGSRTVYDNFLQETVDTSNIIFILTANEEEAIPEWLIDRCIKIYFPAPSRERVVSIIRKHIGEYIKTSSCKGRISISDETLEYMISILYEDGIRSLRQYEGLAEMACKYAYNDMMESNLQIGEITREIVDMARAEDARHRHRSIGFAS